MEPLDLNAKLLSLCEKLQKPELQKILAERWPVFNYTIKAFLDKAEYFNVKNFLSVLASLTPPHQELADEIYQIISEMGRTALSIVESLPPNQQASLQDYLQKCLSLLPGSFQEQFNQTLETIETEAKADDATEPTDFQLESISPQTPFFSRVLLASVLSGYDVTSIPRRIEPLFSFIAEPELTTEQQIEEFKDIFADSLKAMPYLNKQLLEQGIFNISWSRSNLRWFSFREPRSQLELIITSPEGYLRQLHNHISKFWWKTSWADKPKIAALLSALAEDNFLPPGIIDVLATYSKMNPDPIYSLERLRHETYLSAFNSEFLRKKFSSFNFMFHAKALRGQQYFSTTLYYIYEHINPTWEKICQATDPTQRDQALGELKAYLITDLGVTEKDVTRFIPKSTHKSAFTVTYDLSYVEKYARLMRITTYRIFEAVLNKDVSTISQELSCTTEKANRLLAKVFNIPIIKDAPKLSEQTVTHALLQSFGIDASNITLDKNLPIEEQLAQLAPLGLPSILTNSGTFNQNWSTSDRGWSSTLRSDEAQLALALRDPGRYLQILHNHISKFWWQLKAPTENLVASVLAILARNNFLNPELEDELAEKPAGYSLKNLRYITYLSAFTSAPLRTLLNECLFEHRKIGFSEMRSSSSYFSTALYFIYTRINPQWEKVCTATDKTAREEAIAQLGSILKDDFPNIDTTKIQDALNCLEPNEFTITFDLAYIEKHAALSKITNYSIFEAFFRGDEATISKLTGLDGTKLLEQYREEIEHPSQHSSSIETSEDDSTKPSL